MRVQAHGLELALGKERAMRLTGQRDECRGFTLVELMIVVVILGILAAIAIIAFRKYVQKSKTSEAYTILGDIRAKQEAYRAEFSQYCPVNPSLSEGLRHPSSAPRTDGRKVAWDPPVPNAWQQLGVRPDGNVYLGYVTTAGIPPAVCAGEDCPPVDTRDHWWVARAYADLNGNEFMSTYTMLSGARGVIITNEGE